MNRALRNCPATRTRHAVGDRGQRVVGDPAGRRRPGSGAQRTGGWTAQPKPSISGISSAAHSPRISPASPTSPVCRSRLTNSGSACTASVSGRLQQDERDRSAASAIRGRAGQRLVLAGRCRRGSVDLVQPEDRDQRRDRVHERGHAVDVAGSRRPRSSTAASGGPATQASEKTVRRLLIPIARPARVVALQHLRGRTRRTAGTGRRPARSRSPSGRAAPSSRGRRRSARTPIEAGQRGADQQRAADRPAVGEPADQPGQRPRRPAARRPGRR